MERLTARAGNHTYYHHCGMVAVCPAQGCGACEITKKAKDKLADYEDLEEKLEEAMEERERRFGETENREEVKAALMELVRKGYEVCTENCKHFDKVFTGPSACTDAALRALAEKHCKDCPLGKVL